jgi:hypothetical protein
MSATVQLRGRSLMCALLLSACSGSGGPDADPADAFHDPRCDEAVNHSDLEWIQDNIFSRTCSAFSSCHKGNATSAGMLNLEEGNTFENIVDVRADVCEEFAGCDEALDIVEPGVPEKSYMLIILGHYGEGDPRIDPEVGTMPFNNQPICEEKRLAIERWILSLDDAVDDAGPDATPYDAGADAMP